MAWTQSDIDALDVAIRTGRKSLTFADGRKVENYELNQMLEMRKLAKAEVSAAVSQVNPRSRSTVGSVRRG
ncbi:MAG: hypothetical protein KA533_07535 [Sphingobium sp.]|nr:hypothetical protein [Sphingobium sp.]MBP8672404.1 hypothetical protein [Sphingobium sp.]MBP9158601.1 hypothetical protein [Sphingobium sp.]